MKRKGTGAKALMFVRKLKKDINLEAPSDTDTEDANAQVHSVGEHSCSTQMTGRETQRNKERYRDR